MQPLLSLSNGIDAVTRKLGQFADYMVLICALISAGNALVRYFFSYSSNGWLEIQWYLFAAIVLLGASYTLRKNEHVRVDLIYGWVTDRTRLWIDTFGIIIFLLPVSLYFTISCWPQFYMAFSSCFAGTQSSGIGHISNAIWSSTCETSPNASGLIRWPVKLLLVLGFGFLFLQGISELIKRIAGLAGVVKLDLKYEKPLQ